MLCDDICGVVLKIGSSNSYYGYIGDELPTS